MQFKKTALIIFISILVPFSQAFAARVGVNNEHFRKLSTSHYHVLKPVVQGDIRISKAYVNHLSTSMGSKLYAREVEYLINNEWVCGADDYNRMCLIFNHSNSLYLLGRTPYIANSYIKERFPENAFQSNAGFFELVGNEGVNIGTDDWSNVTPTPIPAGIWLMASGFAALIGISGKFSKLRN